MRSLLALALVAAAPSIVDRPNPDQAPGNAGECVKIGKPDAKTVYVFRHEDSSGAITQFTQQWEEVTETGSRHRVTRPNGASVHVNLYRIIDDISRLTSMATSTDRTTFSPAMVGDPVFRGCAGLSWAIPAVTASYVGGGRSASAATPSGTLRIVAVRVPVTVSAGQFQTVHYTRTMSLPKGQIFNQYWKSIDHGVVVQHTATLPNGRASEVLIAIRPAGR